MAEKDGSVSPPAVSQVINAAKSTARASLSPLRQRTLGRASTFSDTYDVSKLRRTSSLSSTFSDSIDDARNSIKSTTDDLLLPRPRDTDEYQNHEPSHWHSVPLALALLPAAGGLFFEKGSIIITDITLLALAAVFLNWSVRLPWDWYHSARAVNVQDGYSTANTHPSDAILEEDDDNEGSQASRAVSPTPSQQTSATSPPDPASDSSSPSSSAASELRLHELLALLTCFVGPLVGAWLLHHIRAQLSRPSEGLVSNYNLTIFLLASELRPLSHLIKLIQARTIHLQRTVASNPHAPCSSGGGGGGAGTTPPLSPNTVHDLTTRLTDLETHVADYTVPSTPNTPSKLVQSQLPDLTTQIRKSFQPDLDALNRAVRRYEKRATLLSMQTEKRLQDLESRMGDAITLAAAAERSSHQSSSTASRWGGGGSRGRRGSGSSSISSIGSAIMSVLDGLVSAALLPLQVVWGVITLPVHIFQALAALMEDFFGGKKQKRRSSSSRRSSGNNHTTSGTESRIRESRNGNGKGVPGGGGGGGYFDRGLGWGNGVGDKRRTQSMMTGSGNGNANGNANGHGKASGGKKLM